MTVEKRQVQLELALAAAYGVTVLHIPLCADAFIPVWDFHFCDELIARGYAITQQALSNWPQKQRSGWRPFYDQLATFLTRRVSK